MKPRYLPFWYFAVCLSAIGTSTTQAGELAVLSEKTWDAYLPKGKEVDAIYGDFVLRNDKLVCVVAKPVPGRNANMTVRDVGGSIIDLTVRSLQSDQLSAYYPGSAGRFAYSLARIFVDGTSIDVVDGKLAKEVDTLQGQQIQLELVAAATADKPEVRLTYSLRDGQDFVEVRTEFVNKSDKQMKLAVTDSFRADRTFQTAPAGETELVWFYDKWWGQAYGVTSPTSKMRLTGSPIEPRVIEFLTNGNSTVDLAPQKSLNVVRMVFPSAHQLGVKAIQRRLAGGSPAIVRNSIQVSDGLGPVAGADVEVKIDDKPHGFGRTGPDGLIDFETPPGKYETSIAALAGSASLHWESPAGAAVSKAVTLDRPSRVVAEITDVNGKPIPCKVQFAGIEGTQSPFFFPDTGEHGVHNLYYSHDGKFTQVIPPGKYEVYVSYGPEYDVEKVRIEAAPGKDTSLKATLRRVVQSPGWVSADFHSHSSPSGDNVSSQLGRVLNLLCEHIEFAPCTEHNRLDTYVPHLTALGVKHLMGTCTGIELTSVPGTINHQNAFPLIMKPRIQDNGAPLTDLDPAEQVKRLALWDNGSDKLVQQNHPDIGEMFYDRDGDGQPDEGYKGMFAYQDVIEVHPIHDVLQMNGLRYAEIEDKKTKIKTKFQYNNTIFNWLQLLNQGRRLPGVVNTDAHYNFHGSGYIRNYVKCQTDDPSKIDPMDIVHAAEKGHIILTNGPYLEVSLSGGDQGAGQSTAIPGNDIAIRNGRATLSVRVQCPNWFDIDRVQVLLNGRPESSLNWTRSANSDAFSDGVVKFDRTIPLELKGDTHVIVVAAAEKSTVGTVMGPQGGNQKPAAISNPIFVDVDGGGFKANGDTLGFPLPVKQARPVPQAKN